MTKKVNNKKKSYTNTKNKQNEMFFDIEIN